MWTVRNPTVRITSDPCPPLPAYPRRSSSRLVLPYMVDHRIVVPQELVGRLGLEGLAGRVEREEDLGSPYNTRRLCRVVVAVFPSREVGLTLLDLVRAARMCEGVDSSWPDDRMKKQCSLLSPAEFLKNKSENDGGEKRRQVVTRDIGDNFQVTVSQTNK